jgi:hypothetical protein
VDSRRLTTSMALIALICFFLPWVHISCGSSENRLSGVDLAREGHSGLWLIPFLMLVVLFFGMARVGKERRELSALTALIAGLVSVYLMNRERMRAEDSSGLIASQLGSHIYYCRLATSTLLVRSTYPGRSVTGLPEAPGKIALAPPAASPLKRSSRVE